MSWAITINDLDNIDKLPPEVYEKACAEHPEYREDAEHAFAVAKYRGLVSATISGGRTPSPYGGPDTVTISIVGFNSRDVGHAVPPMVGRDFNVAMLDTIFNGPDPDDDEGREWHSPYESEFLAPQWNERL